MWWIIGIVAFLVLALIQSSRKDKQAKEKDVDSLNESLGDNIKNLIPAGTYIGGHPMIDERVPKIKLLPSFDSLDIYSTKFQLGEDGISRIYKTEKIASIIMDKIEEIKVEDASTISKKISLGKLAIFGVLAFGMKTNNKKECAYLTISWEDERFNHNTIFELNHTGAYTSANGIRNKIIQYTVNNVKH